MPNAGLAALRARLPPPPHGHGALAFGDARVDACLPGGAGLPLGQMHEIGADGLEAETGTLAAAFTACWLARLPGARPIAWIAPGLDLYPPGLRAYGLDPARLLLVHSSGGSQTLAAMEAALRGGALAAVVAEAGRLPRLAGRRLHLACLDSGVTGFLLRRWPHGVKPGTGAGDAAAASTRWRIAAAPSLPQGRGPGPVRWQVDLTHARGGRPGAWLMQLEPGEHDAPPALRVVAGVADAAAAIRRSA